MQWSRPAWPITWELIAFGIVVLAIVIAASVWRIAGW